jgi:hypothetical protein
LVFGYGTIVRGGNFAVAGELPFHVAVLVGAHEAPHAAPSGGRVAEASFPTWRSDELLDGVLDHGLLRGRRESASRPPCGF